MALFFADLVREASLGTGLGDLALDGALPGHRRFEDIVPPGARFHYAIAGVTHPQEWETGEGEIGSGGTLLRLPLDPSASGGAVDFSAGLKTVALTAGAAWFMAQEEGGAIGIADVEGLPYRARRQGRADRRRFHRLDFRARAWADRRCGRRRRLQDRRRQSGRQSRHRLGRADRNGVARGVRHERDHRRPARAEAEGADRRFAGARTDWKLTWTGRRSPPERSAMPGSAC